jgi:hypothetical protein
MSSIDPDIIPGKASFTHSPDMTSSHLREACSETDKNCTNSVLHALQILCVPPTACLSVSDNGLSPQVFGSTYSQIRKMDEVLKTNRSSIELVSRVLRCQCSKHSSLQLLLVIVCDRLVAWYQAMMSHPSGHATHLQDPLTELTRPGDEQRERILTQPITIGDFPVDPAMQLCIRNQLVLRELQSVQEMIREFAARVQETKSQNSSIQGQRISDILTRLLRDQLQVQSSIRHGYAVLS